MQSRSKLEIACKVTIIFSWSQKYQKVFPIPCCVGEYYFWCYQAPVLVGAPPLRHWSIIVHVTRGWAHCSLHTTTTTFTRVATAVGSFVLTSHNLLHWSAFSSLPTFNFWLLHFCNLVLQRVLWFNLPQWKGSFPGACMRNARWDNVGWNSDVQLHASFCGKFCIFSPFEQNGTKQLLSQRM